MSSDAQIDANRLNAQKSTGPASPEGKAKTRFNSLKTGLYAKSEVIPGEDAAELEALAGDYREEFHPHTPVQMALVDSLIGGDWVLRRLRQSEARMWQQAMEGGADLGQAYQNNPSIDRVMRRVEGLRRSYNRDLRHLEEILEKEAQAAAAEAKAAADQAKAAAVADHAELVRMILNEKEDDGTPAYTPEEARFTASLMQKYGVRTIDALDKAEDAERVHEVDGDASAGPDLASFRSGEEETGNEPDPGDKDPQ